MSYVSPYKSSFVSTRPYDRYPYDRYPYDRYPYYGSPRRQYGGGYSDFIPIPKTYTDYVPEYRVEYRPVEKRYLDY